MVPNKSRMPGGGFAFLWALIAVTLALIPGRAYATDCSTTLTVGSATAAAGDTARVAISIQGNPGVLGATLEVSYSKSLTLKDAQSGDAFSALAFTKPGSLTSPCKFSWDGAEISANDIKDGDVLVLTFEVAKTAKVGSELQVKVIPEEGSFVDGDLNVVNVGPATGVVNVDNFKPGDVDGDRAINSRDVIYVRRHIVGGYDQGINVAAGDVNDDLKVNTTDLIMLRRYIAGGYDVVLKRSRLDSGPGAECETHTLEVVAAKNPTCTEDGNIKYWRCKVCGKCFSDSVGALQISQEDTVIVAPGHVVVIDAAVSPTHTTTGLTEGSHCSVCGEVVLEQEVLPVLGEDEHSITYDVTNGDTYLQGLTIANPNRTTYREGESFTLKNLSVPGYQFLGWYDGAGNDATKFSRVIATDNEDLELYAHWKLITYTVQYESDLFLDTNSATYTVDKGLVLSTPKLSNYVFVGWSDDTGKLYGKRIPAGTTGNITLKANWTSERNKTYTNPNPSDPIVQEFDDENLILFTYEIGRIENVPLYTIKDFGYISGDGVTRSATETYSATTSQSTAETISNVVANATTNSSNWTLSSGWNEATTISEEWCKANGYTKEEAETVAKSDSSNWNVSNSSYGSSSTTNASSSTDGWTNQVKVNGKNANSGSHTDTSGWKVSGELSGGINGGTKIGANAGAASAEKSFGWNVGLKIGGEYSSSSTDTNTWSSERGFEAGGSQSHTGTSSSSATNTAGWNNSSSYGGSSTTSKSNTVSTAISEQISQKTGYGKSYVKSGSESQGLTTSSSNSQTDSYSSATTYNAATSQSVTSSWTTSATKAGYHRWIVAGTAHVFGVVGYDIDSKSFFVYTYNVMDDETHEFEDYSYTTAAYNDQENGVITFEVPYEEVMDTVSDRVFATDGLKVDLATGTIVDYTGTDTCVVIPEYYNAGNGDVVKITGFTKDAFAGNTDVVTVVLSDFITGIPDGAFEGCSSLAFVNGKGVTSIGSRAFAGCAALEDCGVYSKVTHLGEGAFDGADMLYVNAANRDVALAAIDSGAKGLVLNLRFLEDDENVLDGVSFDVPATMDYFELNGEGRTYNGLSINSDAAETVLNKVNVAGTKYLPVKLASGKVTLNQSSISSPGMALALTADNVEVGLRGDTTASSTTANAMLCKNVRLYETASDVVGKLVVPQRLLACGTIEGRQYLQCGDVQAIDEDTFGALLHPTAVSFDAGEGTCGEPARELVYGMPIGELPVAARDYCTFDGWYLEGTDQKVTEFTVLPVGQDLTLVARWIVSWATDIPDGVYSLSSAVDSSYVVAIQINESSYTGGKVGQQLYLNKRQYSVVEQFKFRKNGDGSYEISHLTDGLVFEASAANEFGNPSIRLANNTDADVQKWYIHRNDDGTISLRNKRNGKFVDIYNSQMNIGTAVQCYARNNGKNQKYLLRKERFALFDRGVTWVEAKAVCEEFGGHLATITSASERSSVESLFSGRSASYRYCYWLGGYREGTQWKWVTEEPFSYTNWLEGEPNDCGGIEDKLMMYGRDHSLKWNDQENDYNPKDGEEFNYPNFGFVIEWEDDTLAAQSDATDVYGSTPQYYLVVLEKQADEGIIPAQGEDDAIALGQTEDEAAAEAQGDPAIAVGQDNDVVELGSKVA